MDTLSSKGYSWDCKIINAKDYGVPQNRKRLIIIASKHNPISLPDPTHGPFSKSKKKYITVMEAISRYPPVRAGNLHKKILNHEARDLGLKNKKRLKLIKKNGGSRLDLPSHLQLECHKNHSGHRDVYGRMRWDSVSPTLTCKCTSISNGRFGHPTQTRAISVREAAALQSFDDKFIFYGSLTQNTKWIGNAVPPLLSYRLGRVFNQQAKLLKD